MTKHTILFLAANPGGTDQLALDEEARAIRDELERSGYREAFVLETRWAARPLDLLRALQKLRPTVIHFSGHGQTHTLMFHGSDGIPREVSSHAIAETFGAAGSSVKVAVLSACYSETQAEALVEHVDCVVGMGGAIRGDAARVFAIGFYGGLGNYQSIEAAFKSGRAAIELESLPHGDLPRLKVRRGLDASRIVLGSGPR